MRESRHCPKCKSEDLNYSIDIFENEYTGDCSCSDCKHKFKRKDIVSNYWLNKERVKEVKDKLSKIPVSTENYDWHTGVMWGLNKAQMMLEKELGL